MTLTKRRAICKRAPAIGLAFLLTVGPALGESDLAPSKPLQISATSRRPTGNDYIDGLWQPGNWDLSTAVPANTITYSFPQRQIVFPKSYGAGESAGFATVTPDMAQAIRAALREYSEVIPITFLEVTDTATYHATLRYARSSTVDGAYAAFPSSTLEYAGDVWFTSGPRGDRYTTTKKGTWGYWSFRHETGHALGLKHPHSTQLAGFPILPNATGNAADRDGQMYTVMSYRQGIACGLGNDPSLSFPQSLMQYDVQALQSRYGAKTSTATNIYRWNPTTGEKTINGVAQGAPIANTIYENIYDGTTTSKFDLSTYTTNMTVDLTPGNWSTFDRRQLGKICNGAPPGNVSLSFNQIIRDATTGSGDDIITGNSGNNVVDGGDGANVFKPSVRPGASGEYSSLQSAGACLLVDLRTGSPDGTDTLRNISSIMFSDGPKKLNPATCALSR